MSSRIENQVRINKSLRNEDLSAVISFHMKDTGKKSMSEFSDHLFVFCCCLFFSLQILGIRTRINVSSIAY